MSKSKEQQITKANYRQASHAAVEFVQGFMGDGAYKDSAVNRVALESAIAGWIYAQIWFRGWKRQVEREYPNTDVFLIVQDWALQIADDLAGDKQMFRTRHSRPAVHPGVTALHMKIEAAKKRLGIQI